MWGHCRHMVPACVTLVGNSGMVCVTNEALKPHGYSYRELSGGWPLMHVEDMHQDGAEM